MAYGTVVLRIWQHGPRADDLLAAIAEALGRTETLAPNDGPHQVMLAVIDIEHARKTVEGVLEAAGDEGRLNVELRYPGE